MLVVLTVVLRGVGESKTGTDMWKLRLAQIHFRRAGLRTALDKDILQRL